MTHDLTTEELLELRDHIDSALATRNVVAREGWMRYPREPKPHNEWVYNPGPTSKDYFDYQKIWSGVVPVESAQTHVQP